MRRLEAMIVLAVESLTCTAHRGPSAPCGAHLPWYPAERGTVPGSVEGFTQSPQITLGEQDTFRFGVQFFQQFLREPGLDPA